MVHLKKQQLLLRIHEGQRTFRTPLKDLHKFQVTASALLLLEAEGLIDSAYPHYFRQKGKILYDCLTIEGGLTRKGLAVLKGAAQVTQGGCAK